MTAAIQNDLLVGTVASPSKSPIGPAWPREQRITFTCCGSRWSGSVSHYDRFRCCKCGKAFWALQPRRSGPLVAFEWPGTPEMQHYKQEQFV